MACDAAVCSDGLPCKRTSTGITAGYGSHGRDHVGDLVMHVAHHKFPEVDGGPCQDGRLKRAAEQVGFEECRIHGSCRVR